MINKIAPSSERTKVRKAIKDGLKIELTDDYDLVHKLCNKTLSRQNIQISIDKEEFYHPNCFVCSQCNSSIASKSFYHQAKSDDRQAEGKFLCENCHVKNAAECAECKNKIVSGEASR